MLLYKLNDFPKYYAVVMCVAWKLRAINSENLGEIFRGHGVHIKIL